MRYIINSTIYLFDVEEATEDQNKNMQKAEEIYRIMDKLV